MTTHYKGERIADLLEHIERLENILKSANTDTDHNPFSQAQYEELAHGYATLAVAKARLKALQTPT
jgi:hypothetical protein